eukprot:4908611-Ditylum_brightwellii.AAC.1
MMQYNAETAANLPGTPNLAETPKIPTLERPPVAKKHKTAIHKFCIKIAFIVPSEEDVCPQEKFAAILALIIQQFLATVLQPWDHKERRRAITAGEDLPFKKYHLSVFCPHKCCNDRLTTQWNLQCNMRFYLMQSNQCILDHINSNPTPSLPAGTHWQLNYPNS